MTQLGYFIEEVPDVPAGQGEAFPRRRLSFGPEIGGADRWNPVTGTEVQWTGDHGSVARTLFAPKPTFDVEVAAGTGFDQFLAGFKIGPRLETCYLAVGDCGVNDRPDRRPAVWHGCPVTTIRTKDANTQGAYIVAPPTEANPTEWYLGADGDKAVWVSDVDEACRIRSTRHQLFLSVDMRTGRSKWRYRHGHGQTWGPCDGPLPAQLNDELSFLLQIEGERVPADLVQKVVLKAGPNNNGEGEPWRPVDLVAVGNTAQDSAFAIQGSTRSPFGPYADPSYYYAWGDVMALRTEGRWDIEARVKIAGHWFDSDPDMCVGGGCEGGAPEEDC